MEINRYKKTVSYLESLSSNSISKNGNKSDKSIFLKRLGFLLELLKNPQDNFEYVHITGTSGKGSVSFMVSSILASAGMKTGVFISPFLTTTIERIKVGDKLISIKEFVSLVDYLRPYLDRCERESDYGRPSYFETVLTVAFLYFKKKKCKYVVLEAGIGGSFDATNIIKKPRVCAITNIGLDHINILGNTKKKIALDKSGIIKKGAFFLSTEKQISLKNVFKKTCLNRKAKYIDIKPVYQVLSNDLNGLKFRYKGSIYKTRLIGEHQALNSILAIEIAKCLKIRIKNIKEGISNIVLPGRLELIQEQPTVIIDGAHNPDKMLSTVNFLKRFKYNRLFLITAIAKNKDVSSIFNKIIPLADRVFLTGFKTNKRSSVEKSELKKIAKNAGASNIEFFDKLQDSLKKVLKEADLDDLILVTGSFYLAGELRKNWYSEKFILSNRRMK